MPTKQPEQQSMEVAPSERMKAIRTIFGVNQQAFAVMLGLPRKGGERHVRRWETGEMEPRKVYCNMAEILLRLYVANGIVSRAIGNDYRAIQEFMELVSEED